MEKNAWVRGNFVTWVLSWDLGPFLPLGWNLPLWFSQFSDLQTWTGPQHWPFWVSGLQTTDVEICKPPQLCESFLIINLLKCTYVFMYTHVHILFWFSGWPFLVQSKQLCQERMKVCNQFSQDRTEVEVTWPRPISGGGARAGVQTARLGLGSSPHPQAKLCLGVPSCHGPMSGVQRIDREGGRQSLGWGVEGSCGQVDPGLTWGRGTSSWFRWWWILCPWRCYGLFPLTGETYQSCSNRNFMATL